jgi:carboxyl-terminal processing protease
VTARSSLISLATIGAAFAGGAMFSAASAAREDDGDKTYEKLAIFARVLNYVENNYVEEAEAERLIYGAIRGMLATLDGHSQFMDPEQFAALESEARGEFGGIGVEVVKRDDAIVIVEVHPNTPAAKASLAPKDVITAVAGRATAKAALSDVVGWIKGPPGTKVALTVAKVGGAIEDIVLERDRIRIVSVTFERMEGGFGYVRIKSFTDRTGHDVTQALAKLSASGPLPGVILDLRDNPGGLLEEAVRVADAWLTGGVIVSTEGRNRPPDLELAHPKGTEPAYPLVVLVNGGTASASEIVAGALQDHKRAMLVGTQTYGKGSVQTVIELEDRSALKLTIARYFTPHHRSIQGTGIGPDVVVPLARGTTEGTGVLPEDDNQLAVAVTLLQRWVKGQGGKRPSEREDR